jgi:hypothetical protein
LNDKPVVVPAIGMQQKVIVFGKNVTDLLMFVYLAGGVVGLSANHYRVCLMINQTG